MKFSTLSVALVSLAVVQGFAPHPASTGKSHLLASTEPLFVDETRDNVKDYYGKELQTSDDLATNACCTAGAPPKYIQECINNLHPSTVSRYYGCGLCLPLYDMKDCHVLDWVVGPAVMCTLLRNWLGLMGALWVLI